jgi:hypothetical protein
MDFVCVALNASDPFSRSTGADIGAETDDVRFVWCGRANGILTSNDHAFREVDAPRKVKFKASCFDNRPPMFGPANVSLQTLTKNSGQFRQLNQVEHTGLRHDFGEGFINLTS